MNRKIEVERNIKETEKRILIQEIERSEEDESIKVLRQW